MANSDSVVQMHKDFFDRCRDAIDNRFYMEAILMEYAAIESRLEVIAGLLGLPCNRFAEDSVRKSIQISHRVNCLSKICKQSEAFEKSKLTNRYFNKLKKWIDGRNGYIHGLYKDEIKYDYRMKEARKFAEDGLELCRLLYNETSRLKRLKKSNPGVFDDAIVCASAKCNSFTG